MTPEPKILELIEVGLFRDAAAAIDERAEPTQQLRVLRTQLESHVGNPSRARTAAQDLLRSRLSQTEKACCYEIIGRVSLSFGDEEKGVGAIRRAISLASDSANSRLEARLTASLAEGLLHWVGIEPAAAEISNLRRAAVHAGDAYSLIALHTLVAEIHAKRRSLPRALASLKTARVLLKQFANVWQQGRLAVTSAGVSIIRADYEQALGFTLEALECADRSGSRELRIPALGNLAHIRLAQSSMQECRIALDEILDDVRKGGSTEIGVRDTQMQAALAIGDLDLASGLAAEIIDLSGQLDAGYSYYGLWHLLTRVRWLYRTGEAADGLALAQDAIPRIERMADRNLLERMKLLAAEGLGRVGRAVDGANLMAVAVGANPDPPLEMIAEAARVAGRLAAADDREAARSHFDRAGRILQGIGNLTARAEVERDARDAIVDAVSAMATRPREDSQFARDPESRPPDALLAERIAAVLELAAHPPVLASETLSLLADTQAALSGAIVTTHATEPPETIAAFATLGAPSPLDPGIDAIRIPIGEHCERTFDIVAVPRHSPTARATILAIERLVHASVALANARQQERERVALWPEPSPEQQLGLVCAAESMMDLVKTTRRVAASNITVLISGETGVGKELFARALHQSSPRHARVFLPYNCTTVPRDMLDSQLFGYRRGAFTGAMDDSAGLIRSAAGGTLFLDEIGEMNAEAQPKLLRFLESGEIIPLGESIPQLVDVRIVAATNADLDHLVAAGRFREDLYYRLNVIRLRVPPLRERREEVPLLVDHFLDRCSRELQKPVIRIADDTIEYLVLYRWPGNVRQLANEIRRMVVLAEPGAILMPEHLSPEIFSSRRTIPSSERQLEPNEVVVRIDQPAAAATEHLERALITRALKVADGNLEAAAKALGVSRKGLYNKRRRFGL